MIALSSEQRRFIVDLYARGDQTQNRIAELIGTTQSNVSKILAKARRTGPVVVDRQAPRGPAMRRQTYVVSQLGPPGNPLNIDYL